MIVLYNPLSTTPGKQPLPLSLMSLAAMLEAPASDSGDRGAGVRCRSSVSEFGVGVRCRSSVSDTGAGHAWSLVDGNVVPDPAAEIIARLTDARPSHVQLLAVTVMPGPQLTQAVDVCRRVKAALPHVPIVWGGYFPTQHTDTVLRAP